MILHTIVDPDLIWNKGSDCYERKEITYKGVKLEVIRANESYVVVNRIFSTDLSHYLDPDLQPGSTIKYTLMSQR